MGVLTPPEATMGVMTPPISTEKWKSEDYLILKNAIEGGASLESLAKGAVQFSQKFTLRELQDLWYSAIYDLKTADKVSTIIFELENEHSTLGHSKGSRLSIWKGKVFSSGKRKIDSIRSHYYAMRKRISVEPCTVNRGAPAAPFSFRNSSGYDCHYEYNFQDQNPDDDGCLVQHLLDQEFSYVDDIMRFSSHGNGDNSHHVFHSHCLDSIMGTHRDDMMCHDHDYQNGYAENTYLQLVDGAGLETFENECMGKSPSEFPEEINPLGNSPTDYTLCSINLLEEESLTSPVSNTDNTYNFANEIIESLQVGLGDSLHQLDCASSAATLSLWEVDNPAEIMLMGLELENEFPFRAQGDSNMYPVAYEVSIAEANVKEEQPDAGTNAHVISSESSLVGFSTPSVDFSDDEFFNLDVDDNDLADASCLHGLRPFFLSSPCPSNPDDIEKIGHSKEEDNAPQVKPEECSERTIKCYSQETINHGENVPSVSPELSEKFLHCMLNTEDPEIPDNDDVSFPDRDFAVGDSPMIKEEAASKRTSSVNAKSFSLMSISESFNGHPSSEDFRVSDIAGNGPNLQISQAGVLLSAPDVMIPNLEKHAFSSTSIRLQQDMPSVFLHHAKQHVQGCTTGHRKEMGVQMRQQNCGPYLEQDIVAPGSISDQDEHVSDIENDIPIFADVEAMILDMDLDPDQEPGFFMMEASRSQSIRSKKTIVRLEQGARAFIHRAFLSHRALAVLYGRHLKYFIRNSEVSLGRATDDSKVDIDLSKEGQANKVSRRQAIIKMDEDGLFVLKNIGRHSIYVNSIEVPSKKRISLHSGSLVEICGLRFIFEINQSSVRHYITMNSGQGTIEEFEWKPSQNA